MRFIAPAALLLATSIAAAQQSTAEVAVDAASDPPITINADSSSADFRSGIMRYNDNVSIQRGAMQVNADKGVAHQIDGRIALIELFGNPTTWRDRLDDGSIVDGRANRIEYDLIENVVTLTGDAHLEHEGGQFTGNQLIYDLDTESLAGRSSEGNQVRVVIEGETMRRQTSGNDDPPNEAEAESEPESESESGDDPDDEEPPVEPPAGH